MVQHAIELLKLAFPGVSQHSVDILEFPNLNSEVRGGHLAFGTDLQDTGYLLLETEIYETLTINCFIGATLTQY